MPIVTIGRSGDVATGRTVLCDITSSSTRENHSSKYFCGLNKKFSNIRAYNVRLKQMLLYIKMYLPLQ